MVLRRIIGKNTFDVTVQGAAGPGTGLSREGTSEHPWHPGLLARVTDVHWSSKPQLVTGQFACAGYGNSDITDKGFGESVVDLDTSSPLAQVVFGKRGWLTRGSSILVKRQNVKCYTQFSVCLRGRMFGEHAIVAGGVYVPPIGSADQLAGWSNVPLLCVSLDNGQTWTDLQFPFPTNYGAGFAKNYDIPLLGFYPSSGAWFAAQRHKATNFGQAHYSVVYRIQPASSPDSAPGYTKIADLPFGPSGDPPSSGFPAVPMSVLPVGMYITNDTHWYDDGTNALKYVGMNRGFGWYGGTMTFATADGVVHTLDHKVGHTVELDGMPVAGPSDALLTGYQTMTCGNGLLVAAGVVLPLWRHPPILG